MGSIQVEDCDWNIARVNFVASVELAFLRRVISTIRMSAHNYSKAVRRLNELKLL